MVLRIKDYVNRLSPRSCTRLKMNYLMIMLIYQDNKHIQIKTIMMMIIIIGIEDNCEFICA